MIVGTPGAIGFLDYYSLRHNLSVQFASLKNPAGHCIIAKDESLQSAAVDAAQTFDMSLQLDAINRPGVNSYPLTGFSGLTIPVYRNPDKHALQTLDLLRYILTDGQKTARDSRYVPLPQELLDRELAGLAWLASQ